MNSSKSGQRIKYRIVEVVVCRERPLQRALRRTLNVPSFLPFLFYREDQICPPFPITRSGQLECYFAFAILPFRFHRVTGADWTGCNLLTSNEIHKVIFRNCGILAV